MNASDEYVVTIAKYGQRQTVRSDVFLNYGLYDQDDAPIGMDYFVWVASNGERTVVIDTGFSQHGGAVRGRATLLSPPELFAKIGVDPATSPTVVITHAHYDHIGNLDHFPTSRFVLAAREREFWSGELADRRLFHHSVEDDELAELDRLVAEGRVDLFTGTHAVAPGIEIIELGGHTPGQSVVKVKTSEGIVLVASDAVHYYEEYEKSMPFTSVADLVAMYAGFETIRTMVASGEVAHVVSGHDPDTLSRFTPATGELAGLVATIGGAR
jgi:glyoxylase-like metal-dependent hydrolase (beta-lactamase superfamily II)